MTPKTTLMAAAATLWFAGAAHAAPLTVTVTGIEARGGSLYVGVQTEAQYMKDEGIAGDIVAAPATGTKTFSFDLPEGIYAVSIWHDFNANGSFDTDADGRPLDGWSSINAETLRAAPTFDQVSLAVPAGGEAVSLKMYYPD